MPETKSYTLYYSEAQKLQNEAAQLNKLEATDPSFPGVYIFSDARTNSQYQATEFIADTYLLGFIRLRGRPSYPDAILVAASVPARALNRLRRVAL